jgi:thioredoxin 2
MSHESTIVKCDRCGTRNRIPKGRLGEKPLCGKCKTPLRVGPFFDAPVTVTDGTFDSEVKGYPGPVLLDAWAPWCGPCKMVGPVLEELARTYAGRVKIAKLNVDENPLTASKYAIRSIPTLFFFKKGEMVNSIVGALPREEIERHLRAIL